MQFGSLGALCIALTEKLCGFFLKTFFLCQKLVVDTYENHWSTYFKLGEWINQKQI